ncbi:MAG: glycosyltransferase family 4 protein [Candidatus Hodarchaeota archaeon]
MKILQLVPYFFPYQGGQERYIYNLSKYLVKRGHLVHIVTSNFPKSKEFEIKDGISIERYKCLIRPLRNPITPNFLTFSKKIKEYDIVHTHNEHSFAAMVTAYFRRKNDIPLVLTCHGQLKFGSYFGDLFERAYSKSVGLKIFDTVDVICVNSIMDKDYLLSLDQNLLNKIKVLSNAIDPEFFEILSSETIRDERVDIIKIKSKIILYVGRLIKRKGIEWLIKAINIIVNKHKINDIILILVGEGEDKNYFRKLIKRYRLNNYILFLNSIGNEELVHCYRNSSIFVLPSLSEVCPTVVLEAMYFGLPIVATEIPGIKDHFKNYALLVPPKNEIEIANAILKLFNDKELAERLSKIGEELIKQKYTWNNVAKKYEDVYQRMVT